MGEYSEKKKKEKTCIYYQAHVKGTEHWTLNSFPVYP